MKKLIILFLITCSYSYSQDTIAFISKEKTAVKVTEVGINDIKYNRWDNLTGPQYIINKRDVNWIKFANGHVDTIKVSPIINQSYSSSNSNFNTYTTIESDKIMINRDRLIYHGRGLSDNKLYVLIGNVANPDLKKDLLNDYAKMINNRRNQYIFGFGGLGLGVASALIGVSSEIGNYGGTGEYAIIGLGTGVTFGIAGAVISGINKGLRNKRKISIAQRYNDYK